VNRASWFIDEEWSPGDTDSDEKDDITIHVHVQVLYIFSLLLAFLSQD
jgi:hypothetical protein